MWCLLFLSLLQSAWSPSIWPPFWGVFTYFRWLAHLNPPNRRRKINPESKEKSVPEKQQSTRRAEAWPRVNLLARGCLLLRLTHLHTFCPHKMTHPHAEDVILNLIKRKKSCSQPVMLGWRWKTQGPRGQGDSGNRGLSLSLETLPSSSAVLSHPPVPFLLANFISPWPWLCTPWPVSLLFFSSL